MSKDNDGQEEADAHYDEIEMYKNCLKQVRQRLLFIKEKLEKGSDEINKYIDTEIICLQFRSIIELILLSSLAAHKKLYTQSLDHIQKQWRIKDIVKIIQEVNPNFYPVAVDHTFDKEAVFIDMKIKESGFLTLDEALNLYNECSDYIHPRNPFKKPQDYIIWDKFKGWFVKIATLLKFHVLDMFVSQKGIFAFINFIDDGTEPVFAIYLKVEKTEVHP